MSTEHEIRDQLEASYREGRARSKLRELIRDGQWVSATAVARALGVELPVNQVVRVDFARPRT